MRDSQKNLACRARGLSPLLDLTRLGKAIAKANGLIHDRELIYAKKTAPPNEQRVVLPNVSWEQFEQLIIELGIDRLVRLTYARGKLEMMTPVAEHDRCHKLLESLVLVVADELKRPVESIAPVMLKKPRPALRYRT